MVIETLIFGSLEHQIVGVFIVRFPKHQQCNVNLQKEHYGGSADLLSDDEVSKKCEEGEENRSI